MSNKKRSERVTQAELDGDVFIAVKLTPAQQKEADIALRAARKKTQEEMTENDRKISRLFQLRFQMEDYIEKKAFDPKMAFGYFLKEYVDRLNIKRKVFAGEISIDETLLSQLINMHRLPPDYLPIRLEIHSGNMIAADNWYKLVEMQRAHLIKTDKELRRREGKFVHNRLAMNP
jgi:hypothetical protein